MKKTNWKVIVFIWISSFLVVFFLFNLDGAIGAAISALLAYILVFLITKLFKIDMYIYYDQNGKRISKEEYEQK